MALSIQYLVFFMCVNYGFGNFLRLTFEKCGTKGFYCTDSKEIEKKLDIVFQCSNQTSQEVTLYLWSFNSPGTITSLTVKDCDTVQLSLTCTNENKPIRWLKIVNVKALEIIPALITHNPPIMIFENISYIKTLPNDMFVQIQQTLHKPGCFYPVEDLHSVYFKNVSIGIIEPEAFKRLINMRNFSWTDVSVNRLGYSSIKLKFVQNGKAIFKNCNIEVVEPMAIQITGDKLSITECQLGDIWGSGINGTIYDFEFNNNSVDNLQAGAISILTKRVYMLNNFFRSIESGALKKISPGLLHDSQRNFGQLLFIYKFENNLIEHVEDGGIRPDIEAYKNVAAEVSYAQNTMQCSCESLTWLGTDIDLGYGFSVLNDFNTMILDPVNKNKCNFTPCMCFGVRSPHKKNSPVVNIF